MFDDPFYGNQYSSPSQKQKQQVICYALIMEWICLCESRNGRGRHNLRVFCVLNYLRTWIIPLSGWGWVGGKAMPVNSIDLKRRVWTKWNSWGFFNFILNEYLSECIVWFKNISFVQNIWKFLLRHKRKVISFSHCKGNKNLMIIELDLI